MIAKPDPDRILDRVLSGWATGIVRFRWLWIGLTLTLGAASLFYAFENLGVDMDTTKLLSPDLPFQKDRARMQQLFPYDLRCIVVVVESPTPEQSLWAARQLSERLALEKNHVQSVYLPGQGAFFDRHALLFLKTGQLEKVAAEISRAQPFIGRLAQNNTLGEFLSLVSTVIGDPTASPGIGPLLPEMATAIENVLRGAPRRLSWQEMMLQASPELNKKTQLLLVKPVFQYDRFVPAGKSVEAVRHITEAFAQAQPEVTIRLTGEVALEHEELLSISKGITLAALSSALLVSICLIVGLGSLILIAATLITLMAGLSLSAGFATFAVGHLNVISVSFAVLYLGLGVDYAIHFCLQYKELSHQGNHDKRTIIETLRAVGPSIILCTITTAIGFYAFIPTAYKGVAELGVIAGSAMFISCFVTLTTLPALLALTKTDSAGHKRKPVRLPQWIYLFPLRHARTIQAASFLLAVGGSILLLDVRFDFSPINLRDPNTESVIAFKQLLRKKDSPLMTINVLAADRAAAQAKSRRLESLDVVDHTLSIESFIPPDQEDKLAIIDDLAMILGPGLASFPAPAAITDPREPMKALNRLARTLSGRLAIEPAGPTRQTLERLDLQVHTLLERLETATPDSKLRKLEQLQDSLLGNLPHAMQKLSMALEAGPVEDIDDLPETLAMRWISQTGIFRIEVYPSEDLNPLENQLAFVTGVKAVEPHATGLPVQYLESGLEVVSAFRQAFFNAAIAIAVITLLVLRSLKETLLIFYLLALVSLATGSASVILDVPFNFANIIALPLLLGLGVDSAIHLIHRLRTNRQQQWRILHTSTAKGVFFSTLTTVFSFISLAFVSHAGTASLGKLLTVGIVSTLLCMLVVLPAFAAKGPPPKTRR